MKGTFYGIGVGPGDPELLTLKAVRLIRQCPVLASPMASGGDGVAYTIAQGAVPELAEKEKLTLDLPMVRDKEILAQARRNAALQIAAKLEEGKDVCFLTLGDPMVYSTFTYLAHLVEEQGGQVEIVPGITSFCASAAKLGVPLGEEKEPVHIIPASYPVLETALDWPGSKVLMKSGKALRQVKEQLAKRSVSVQMEENCTMEGERIFHSLEEIVPTAGYFSVLIVKEQEE